jgi:hypothetical protein
MTIIICDEKHKYLSIRTDHVFEYKPVDAWKTWGISVKKGCTTHTTLHGELIKVYQIDLYFGGTQLFDIQVYADDDFYLEFQNLLKTQSVASIQHTIKLSEEVVKYAFQKMMKQPNFPGSIGLLLREVYETGVSSGEEAVSMKIKSALKIE